ncbi:L-selectin-like [Salvelinus alpinus]|uniref:L-selectin-like n=1 Tax=Salvelinus alpinus TaxID=8036 RepID=UPI0039FDD424
MTDFDDKICPRRTAASPSCLSEHSTTRQAVHGPFFRQPQVVTMMWMLLIVLGMCGGRAMGWTYHFSTETMNWTMAREWCRINNHTDMVVIQNQEENNYLRNILPDRPGSPYYWIGIKKINGNWTWVGTNGTWVGNYSWAPNEPNNKLGEECVEMYINKGNSENNGKWNDDKCSNLKYPLCYRDQCSQTSCKGQGRCLETINNFTCVCEPEFEGHGCQTVRIHLRIRHYDRSLLYPTVVLKPFFAPKAKGCEPLCLPDGFVNCSAVNSTCRLSCEKGSLLLGSPEVSCSMDGVWTGVWGDDIWSRIWVWSGQRPICASYQHVLMVVAAGWMLSLSCCICCCFNRRKRKKHAQLREPEEGVTSSNETGDN